MASEEQAKPPGNLILACVPTKNGMFSTTFLSSLLGIQTPINASLGWSFAIGKPVDEARNALVESAKAMKAKYIMFIDDDTLIPPFTIPRLLNMNVKVASGVYYTKTQPPTPVILRRDVPGGFKDWQYGDVITVDYIGLGCCLIDMTVFDDIEPPYFYYKKGMRGPEDTPDTIGEDVYFCDKVAKAGHKIWVDTVVQCHHEDNPTKTTYFYNRPTNTGAWRGPDGKIYYIPPAEHPERKDPKANAVKGAKLCWGYGVGQLEGFTEANDVDLNALREKYIEVEEITARNLLEFGTSEQAQAILVGMQKIMRDGAKLEVEVPNVLPYIKKVDDSSGVNYLQAIFGWQDGKYRSAYTAKCLDELAVNAGFKQVSVREDGDKLVLEGVK
jgi:hypothetical protein